jgi:hypothetical protein
VVLIIEIINNTLGFFFENDVKNRIDLKIFNCKLNYNDYIHNYNYTNPLFTAYNLRFGKGSTPKMAAWERLIRSVQQPYIIFIVILYCNTDISCYCNIALFIQSLWFLWHATCPHCVPIFDVGCTPGPPSWRRQRS